MKKLFTLIALLACVFGANAKTVVDAEVDFSQCSEIKYYSWGGSSSAKERLSLVDGCLHFQSTEATDPTWDCQFFPIGGVDAEVGVTYTLHYKVKGDHAENISMLGFGQTPYGAFPITTDWVEGTVEYECTDASGGNILCQCGGFVGTFDIAYLKITHEEREQRPVEWVNMLTNGDAEGEYGDPACMQSKEFGQDLDENGSPQIHNAAIEDQGGNKVFAIHAKAVDPIITWDEDGEQWGVTHKAGDPKPDNAWQNQVWITLPRALKSGEQYKVSFKYKASKGVNTSTQNHTTPGNYLDGGQLGDVKFTTDWQTFEKTCTASATMQSIAFNLGEEIYTENLDFYFDDVNVSLMKLDEGYFVASTNTETGLVDYDLDNAIQFTYDEESQAYVATVGTAGNQDSWVNEVMISTVRGNDKAFKSATLKCTASKDPDAWSDYTATSNAKIALPASGVWKISIDESFMQMNFVEIEGEKVKEPIEINANPSVITVNGVEREYTSSETAPEGYEFKKNEDGTTIYGNAWDNQLIIMGNRALKAGEETVIEFDYSSSIDATVGTQNGGGEYAGQYLHWKGLGDIAFTTAEQHFSQTVTIPTEADGQQAFNFNMAVIKDACTYTIKNVIWKLSDNTESLIDQEGVNNFYVKEGAGTNPHIYGTDGINYIVNDKVVSNASYNLAGQRVAKNYKGLVIKNGVKYIAK